MLQPKSPEQQRPPRRVGETGHGNRRRIKSINPPKKEGAGQGVIGRIRCRVSRSSSPYHSSSNATEIILISTPFLSVFIRPVLSSPRVTVWLRESLQPDDTSAEARVPV